MAGSDEGRDALGVVGLGGEQRQVNVTRAFAAMFDVSFLFQNPQQGADGRIAGRIRQRGQDFGGAGPPALVQHIHDLAFAAAEVGFVAHNESARILALLARPSTGNC